MKIVSTASEMHELSRANRAPGCRIGFVPTMGALHDGHLSLVRRARELAKFVVVSIFVNPTQFGPKEDFSKYPRDLQADLKKLSSLDIDCVFAPEPGEIYSQDFRTHVEVEDWGKRLCGSTRPGHFRGVTTVVAKLFNIVTPDVAVFGQKDAQQAFIIRRMVRDLNFDVEIVIAPIVRESDGLAMSSRNRYLSAEERRSATVLFRSLQKAQTLVGEGNVRVSSIVESMREIFDREPSAKIDYIEWVDSTTLEPIDEVEEGSLLAVAAFVGSTRLIDNWIVPAMSRH
ncbi:MAG: pantoate--beta-alanine ligase [Acidobacteriia bacterium]|nr:pantoate--beta-alanine ligase [Terriglobia bacterium]